MPDHQRLLFVLAATSASGFALIFAAAQLLL